MCVHRLVFGSGGMLPSMWLNHKVLYFSTHELHDVDVMQSVDIWIHAVYLLDHALKVLCLFSLLLFSFIHGFLV
jgi:hypothetical protein